MTIETRTLIELSDIQGIEIECPKCHVRTTREFATENIIPSKCTTALCGQIFYADPSRDHSDFVNALDTLGRMAESKASPFLFRLLITNQAGKQ